MAEVFADTSGWAEYFLATLPQHAAAADIIRRWRARRTRVVTTNYVVTELVALLVSPLRVYHARRDEIIDSLRSASWVEIAHVTPEIDQEAWELLKRRPDKDWSLVDASSFVVVRQRGIIDALTADHHFAQAGFVRILA